MRARNIKPGFFSNELLIELPPLVRILFAGLWCIADREGRLEDRPARIKLLVLPGDDCDIDEMLAELSARNFIIRYAVNCKNCIQVVNFKKHQNPHKHEPASSLPPMVVGRPPMADSERIRNQESGIRNQESGRHADHGMSGVYLHVPPMAVASQPMAVDHAKPLVVNGFDPEPGWRQFWERWPHKVDEEEWLQAWLSHVVNAEVEAQVFEGLSRWEISEQWAGGAYQGWYKWFVKGQYKAHPAPRKLREPGKTRTERLAAKLQEELDAKSH